MNTKISKVLQVLSVVAAVSLSSCKKDKIEPTPTSNTSTNSSTSTTSLGKESANNSPDAVVDLAKLASSRVGDFQKTVLTTIASIPVYQKSGNNAFFFNAAFDVEAAGAPRAYNANNALALQDLSMAGSNGNWWGIATSNGQSNGMPVIQGVNDPAPGFYVSTTALAYSNRTVNDPRRYVDATTVPYVVLPPALKNSGVAKLGDFAAVINKKTGNVAYAIFADIGANGELGVGSVNLATKLALNSNARTGGTQSKDLCYIVFPGSGNGQPRTLTEISTNGAKLLSAWGGYDALLATFSTTTTAPVVTAAPPATSTATSGTTSTTTTKPTTTTTTTTTTKPTTTTTTPVVTTPTPAPVIAPAPVVAPAPVQTASKIAFTTSAGIQVWKKSAGDSPFFFESQCMVDADGSPRCYNKNDAIALDNLEMAGYPGNWWALATDNDSEDGNPIVQGPNDPAPGFYVSMTSLADPTLASSDPRKYVNAEVIPYFVLPPALKASGKAKVGDFGVMINSATGQMTYGIFADVGPEGKLGEISMKAAGDIGVNNNPKTGGVTTKSIIYLVFPGSGNGLPRTAAEISAQGQTLLNNWGGAELLKNYFKNPA